MSVVRSSSTRAGRRRCASSCPRRSSSLGAARCAYGCPRSRPSASARWSRRPRRSSRRRPSRALRTPTSGSLPFATALARITLKILASACPHGRLGGRYRGLRKRRSARRRREGRRRDDHPGRVHQVAHRGGQEPESGGRRHGARPARLREVRGREEEAAGAGPEQADRQRAEEAVQDRVHDAPAPGHAVPDPGLVGRAGGRQAEHHGLGQERAGVVGEAEEAGLPDREGLPAVPQDLGHVRGRHPLPRQARAAPAEADEEGHRRRQEGQRRRTSRRTTTRTRRASPSPNAATCSWF